MGQNARFASRQARVIRHSLPPLSRPTWTYLRHASGFFEIRCLPFPNDLVSACTPCPRPTCPSFHCQYTRARVLCIKCHLVAPPQRHEFADSASYAIPSSTHIRHALCRDLTLHCHAIAANCQCLSTPQKALCQGLEEKTARALSAHRAPQNKSQRRRGDCAKRLIAKEAGAPSAQFTGTDCIRDTGVQHRVGLYSLGHISEE
jgi:hypothetical protein